MIIMQKWQRKRIPLQAFYLLQINPGVPAAHQLGVANAGLVQLLLRRAVRLIEHVPQLGGAQRPHDRLPAGSVPVVADRNGDAAAAVVRIVAAFALAPAGCHLELLRHQLLSLQPKGQLSA